MRRDRCMEAGDVIERRWEGCVTRGVVMSNDRDGTLIMATNGWNFHIPSTGIRILTEADGDVYTKTKRTCERHILRFRQG